MQILEKSSALQKLLNNKLLAAQIKMHGENPWDIKVHDHRFFPKVIREGSLGFGESYMDGWWDCKQLDECIHRILRTPSINAWEPSLKSLWQYLKASFLNLQSKKKALVVGKKHYDIGNDLFSKMLDRYMTYSCAYWKDAKTLDEAQEAKLELICRKLSLKRGEKILDIGCGWGSFAKYAAEKHGVHVVGITISKEQLELGKERCRGLPIELRFQDYRDVDESFDHIVSVGQMEHVGQKNYRTYMKMANRCLKDKGLFLLHTIGNSMSYKDTDPWIEKYIFPNGKLPSLKQLTHSWEGLFVMEDWHNFGADYDRTLMAWHDNFQKHWDELKDKYDERFRRMWSYYLLSCAGAFRARQIQLWQIVLSKNGVVGGYRRVS